MNGLAGLVLDIEFSFDNDLHLVVVVGVNQRGAFLEPVETSAYGLLRIGTGDNVAQVCVLIGDQGGLELFLRLRKMLECG